MGRHGWRAPVKRVIVFFDGQNLYRHAKDAFGHHHPNHDPKKPFDAVCADKRWVNLSWCICVPAYP